MNSQIAIKNSILSEMDLNYHSEKCISLFVKCLSGIEKREEMYKSQEDIHNKNLKKHISDFTNHCRALNIIYRPQIGFGEELLNREDERFFNKPLFLPFNKQQEIIHKVASYYKITEDLYFEKIIAPMNDIVDEWLSSCWQKASDVKNFDSPIHLSMNRQERSSVKTLLEGSYYNLESSTINRIKLWKILTTFGNIQTSTTLN
ncbi:hypothetical protein SAMN04489761_1861 [Tenacibaculum sp. MAR_2009_124]|uniref:hypothetical protein n=1 Tax=Tenacibaculum sp. MAR_2009_124 TaxID=1250059 RepID=UPI0008979752|nr:hypothetical protein [Tenacibaculum sp. MAR_2009_124]SEB81721.1 hypothetical protein SAMN04489761_1861 [Tenacibaculum sp. MAR_2009_124]